MPLLAMLLLLQDPAPGKGPIARVVVVPGAELTVQAGDTARLGVEAYDAGGRKLDATVRWFQVGGRFEGSVDDQGRVIMGHVGSVRAAARVSVPGGATTTFAVVRATPAPAARIGLASEPPATLYAGQTFSLDATAYSAAGDRRDDAVACTSDRPAVLEVSGTCRVSARTAGKAGVTLAAGKATRRLEFTVSAVKVAAVSVTPGRGTARTGDVVRLAFTARDAGGKPIAGVKPEWSVLGRGAEVDAEGAFVAEAPGVHRVIGSFAGRTAEAVITVSARDATLPVKVVGRLPLPLTMAEFWLHPNGKAGYASTLADRIYAIDLTDPAAPRITDSIVVDARVVNDVMTTADGKIGVLTREGSSSRKNGIVLFSAADPLHPRVISEYTETVSGGVHSTFIYKDHIYLTDDATGSLRVIAIADPVHPREVARWETPGGFEGGRTVHDVDVQDGLAYLSYWNDGLVILDVGNGVKGGSPEKPVFVSQLKYDLESLYRDVALDGGPGYIRGTHTAWRHGKYVFVGDEVFSATPSWVGGPLGLGRAFGRLHVVDVSDLSRPKLVAWFEPKDGGAHNVWVAGDTLLLGDYQGGARIVDISGELKGDLLAQGREIAHVMTADRQGVLPAAVMTWGGIYRDGLFYLNDMNAGLWIVRLDPKKAYTP